MAIYKADKYERDAIRQQIKNKLEFAKTYIQISNEALDKANRLLRDADALKDEINEEF